MRRGRDRQRGGVPSDGRGAQAQFAGMFTATDARYEFERRSGTTWIDWVSPSRTLAVTAGTATVSASSANFAGKPAMLCDGTVTFKSNQASSFFQKLTDGTGGQLYVIARRTAQGSTPWQLWGTRNPGEPGGFYRGLTTTDDASMFTTGTAAGILYLDNAVPAGLPVGASNLYGWSYSEAESPKCAVRKGASIVSSGPSLIVPGTTPGETLTFATGLPCEYAAIWYFGRILSAAEYSVLAAWASTFGVAA